MGRIPSGPGMAICYNAVRFNQFQQGISGMRRVFIRTESGVSAIAAAGCAIGDAAAAIGETVRPEPGMGDSIAGGCQESPGLRVCERPGTRLRILC